MLSDSLWIRNAFMIPPEGSFTPRGGYESGRQRRLATSAAYKYTNSSLGGNYTINNPPQFTPYADIRVPGRGRRDNDWQDGMGRYYSEAIDDPRQVVHMSFGVPRYNTMANFFTNFYDSRMARLANTGRSSTTFYNLGLVGGYVVSLPLQPFILGMTAISRVYQFITKSSPSKWYYFKPTMHSYWSAVNTIANDIAINMGLIPRVLGEEQAELKEPGQDMTNEELMTEMNRVMPDIFRIDGGVDIMALANRTQRMANVAYEAEARLREEATNIDELHSRMAAYANEVMTDPNPAASSRKYFEEYVKAEGESEVGAFTESFTEWSDLKGLNNFMEANMRAGMQFASFRVNHKGSVSESFSNSTGESDIASTINTKAQQGRSLSFNLMGGNVNGVIGTAMDMMQSFISGAADAVKLGGLATLAGTAFIDVPKMWTGSTADLPRADYTIPLYSPYGNPLSRYINMYIPIAMILAGALPLSAGRAAYTSPFLCQIYHQGRVQCQLGMIDSVTITRGTGNVGWNAENQMLGAEITFSVVDMSSIMHAPIKGAFGGQNNAALTLLQSAAAGVGEGIGGDVGAAAGLALTNQSVWDEQSAFGDYMAVLGGLSVDDTYYFRKRLNLNMTRALRSFQTWRSPSNFYAWMGQLSGARSLMQFAQTTDRF